MDIVLKCKDFDAWVSFLGRLNKIGSKFVIKNDIIFPTVNGTKSGSNDRIPGRHITKDPLFINDEDSFIENALYVTNYTLEEMLEIFKSIKADNKEARKKIVMSRDREGISITFNGMKPLQLFSLIDRNYCSEEDYQSYLSKTSGLTWFKDFVDSCDEWRKIDTYDLIDLRNNSLKIIRQEVEGNVLWARIARSIFTMSGVTRLDTPLAESVLYTFLHSENIQKDTALLRIHARYKSPGNSNLIKVECIHEYVVLIYDEGDTDEE